MEVYCTLHSVLATAEARSGRGGVGLPVSCRTWAGIAQKADSMRPFNRPRLGARTVDFVPLPWLYSRVKQVEFYSPVISVSGMIQIL